MEAGSTTDPLIRSGPPARPIGPLSGLIFRRATSGGAARVREEAARQLEERRADWAYSRPVVALDIVWNLVFAVAAMVVLTASYGERPSTPLRLWVAGYLFQSLVHVTLVYAEYRRRRARASGVENGNSDSGGNESEGDGVEVGEERRRRSSIPKKCETVNTMVSILWWAVGFYWVASGGETLKQNAPTLYWLAVVFLGFDFFFAIFCMALACLIAVALCCCLPCIIAVLYAIGSEEGASDADITTLPRYRYVEPYDDGQQTSVGTGAMIPILSDSNSLSSQRLLGSEDAECCICLTSYENGVELHALPCNHHFHSSCIEKWLRINATCPLCKDSILRGYDAV